MTAQPMPVYTESILPAEPWVQGAACAQVDPDIFFPEPGDHQAVRDARKVCRSCDVQTECMAFAIRERPRYGIWAGLSRKQRDSYGSAA